MMIQTDRLCIKRLLFLLGLIWFLSACTQAMGSETNQGSKRIEPAMEMPKKIPPIDIAAPSKFETASFGLG
jgi:hypothetical protein